MLCIAAKRMGEIVIHVRYCSQEDGGDCDLVIAQHQNNTQRVMRSIIGEQKKRQSVDKHSDEYRHRQIVTQ